MQTLAIMLFNARILMENGKKTAESSTICGISHEMHFPPRWLCLTISKTVIFHLIKSKTLVTYITAKHRDKLTLKRVWQERVINITTLTLVMPHPTDTSCWITYLLSEECGISLHIQKKGLGEGQHLLRNRSLCYTTCILQSIMNRL